MEAVNVVRVLFMVALVTGLCMPVHAEPIINPSQAQNLPDVVITKLQEWFTGATGSQGAQGLKGIPGLDNFTAQYYNASNFTATSNITYFFNSTNVTAYSNYTVIEGNVTDHHFLTNLTVDDHLQYANLSGRLGGQSLAGSNSLGGFLILNSTSHATKGVVAINVDGTFTGIGMFPSKGLDVISDAGVLNLAGNRADNATKSSRYTMPDYDTDLTTVGVFYAFSNSVRNILNIGSGETNKIPLQRIYFSTNTSPTITGSTERMRIDEYGNVSIATTQGLATLQVNGTLRFPSVAGGTLTTDAGGNVYVVSDEKLKTKIKPMVSGLTGIKNTTPITFKFKPESGLDTVNTYSGFSADNLLINIPEAVTATPDYNYVSQCTKGKTPDEDACIMVPVWKGTYTYAVNDRAIIGALTNAVKEQQAIIDKLDERIRALEKKVGI